MKVNELEWVLLESLFTVSKTISSSKSLGRRRAIWQIYQQSGPLRTV